MCALVIRKLTKQYNARENPALIDLNLSTEPGELLALVGASGSGKSTLLRLIAGLEQADKGSITISGKEVSGPSQHLPPEKRGVGMVFQDFALFPHLTVRQNIQFGLSGMSVAEQQSRADELLEMIHMTSFAERYPNSLSGGEQQRIALARSLAPSPALLLLDEPFSNLDESLKKELRRDVQRIVARTATTTILVTHDINDALTIADRIAILRNGQLQQLDRPEKMYQQPVNPYVASFFGEINLVAAEKRPKGFQTPYGFITAETTNAPENCLLGIRPSAIKIVANSQDKGLRGQAGRRTFMGDIHVIEIQLTAADHPSVNWIAYVPAQQVIETGTSIALQPDPDLLLIFPGTP